MKALLDKLANRVLSGLGLELDFSVDLRECFLSEITPTLRGDPYLLRIDSDDTIRRALGVGRTAARKGPLQPMARKRRGLTGKCLLVASGGLALVGCGDGSVGNPGFQPTVLCIDSVPSAAQVFVDGDPLEDDGCNSVFGETALVTATAEGYEPFEQLVDVVFDGTNTFTVVMTEEDPSR